MLPAIMMLWVWLATPLCLFSLSYQKLTDYADVPCIPQIQEPSEENDDAPLQNDLYFEEQRSEKEEENSQSNVDGFITYRKIILLGIFSDIAFIQPDLKKSILYFPPLFILQHSWKYHL